MKREKKNALLIIDAQNDFCDKKGSLYVKGAEDDMNRVASFIMRNMDELDSIILTLDSHRVIDISHPAGWVDENGNPISSSGFVPISHQDILDGKYTWTINPMWPKTYTEKIEASKNFTHLIWPEHCIIGTWGHNIFPAVADAVHAWERKRGGVGGAEYVTKGSNPLTEHFGAFQAQVPIDNQPGTQPNIRLLNALTLHSTLFVCGEARSHCVVSSCQQILDLAPELGPKMVILEDCMSDVPSPPGVDFSQNFPPIAERGRKMGMRFQKSTDPIGQAAAAVI